MDLISSHSPSVQEWLAQARTTRSQQQQSSLQQQKVSTLYLPHADLQVSFNITNMFLGRTLGIYCLGSVGNEKFIRLFWCMLCIYIHLLFKPTFAHQMGTDTLGVGIVPE